MSARKLVPVLVVVALAAVAAFALLRRKVDLILLNPTAAAVKVTVNGAPFEVPAAGRLLVPGVSPHLELTADAAPVAVGASGASSAKTLVWSVAPVTTWWTVSKGYGDLVGKAPASVAFVPSSSPVFALPDDHTLVDEALPENATVAKGVTGTVLRALWSDAFARRTAPPLVMLVIHNDSTDTLRVQRDGAALADLPADAVMHLPDHPTGPLELRAVALDATGKETGRVHTIAPDLVPSAPLSPPAVHVWDITGATRFWVVSRRYGPNPDAEGPPPPPAPFEVPAGQSPTFFTLPAGFFHEVDAPYPDTWPRQELLKLLWCDDYLRKQSGPAIPEEIRQQFDKATRDRGARTTTPPAPPPTTTTTAPKGAFPPVPDDEREGD